MQWSHRPSDESEYVGDVHVIGPLEPQTTYEVSFVVGSSAEGALQRFLGCVLIAAMPDEGLEEALFSLRDMLQFYGQKPAPAAPKLTPRAIHATVRDKEKRPNLVIA